MKAFGVLFSILVFSSFAHAQKVPNAIVESLTGLRIEKIDLNEKALKVVYLDEKISDLMAISAAHSICGTRYLTPKGFNDDAIEVVKVYNHWEMQGYEFKLNGKACDELGKLASDDYNDAIRKIMTPL
ncbi:hypothetical protein [Citrobacter sp. Cpo091]|uniref:hypothetical protein n=1 Tax=Citrobacter sp. Cpo091 TaxID=2985140 RepID=UPI0025750A67|nr:hypothetical protein [Citrobacter sp. Cpo091]MDM2835745.1 hypothetical protein [Citrobacter sp. Cpo091]